MYLIAVNGPSGSGKTTIVNLIYQVLTNFNLNVKIVSMDQFYKSLNLDETPNWDHIDAIDIELLIEKLVELKNGKNVWFPHYDYAIHQGIPDTYLIQNVDILILEGIFTLYDARIRNLANLKIYIDADLFRFCLPRRYARDIAVRSRNGQSIIDQYMKQVVWGYEQFVKPTKKYADLIYINELQEPNEDIPFIQMVCLYVLQKFNKL